MPAGEEHPAGDRRPPAAHEKSRAAPTADVVVVGAGFVGRCVAWSLLRRFPTLRVRLLESGSQARGASSCAAGLAGPQSACAIDDTPDRFDLYLRAHVRLSELGLELAERGAGAPTPRSTGALLVSHDDRTARRYADAARRQLRRGLSVEIVTALQLMEVEPALAGNLAGGVLFRDDATWSPPELMDALELGLQHDGVPIEYGVTAHDLKRVGGRVLGVVTDAGTIECGHVVLCNALGGQSWLEKAGIRTPIRAERGQILELGPHERSPEHIILSRDVSLIPLARSDGRFGLVLSSTMEPGIVDPAVTLGGIERLTLDAARLLPGVRERSLLAARAGIRAMTPDGLPLVGPVPGLRGLHVCTAHGRWGILTGALTAEVMAWGLDDREWPQWAQRLRCEREASDGRD